MATIDELKKIRIKKLATFKSAGIDPYPLKIKRTHSIAELFSNFNKLKKSEKQITAVGRIMSIREHGALSFSHIEDGSGKIQTFFSRNKLGKNAYNFFLENFDIGDFIQISGILFKTKRKEKTIEVSKYHILSKSLLALPEKWHGLQDVEERSRKRYLDLIFNKEVKEKFETRSKIIKEIRNFLDKNEFLEVETPILQSIYGGAKAKPFKTHLNALDMDLYLKIAHELYLKRLLVGGFEKVYEIGRIFRNEGVDRSHNPEFTMLEFYWAYADYKNLMKFTEKLIINLIKKTNKKLEIEYKEKKINFKAPWERIEFSQLLRKYTKIDLEDLNTEALAKKAKELGIKIEKGASKAEIADEIYKKYCRPKIVNPTFVIHHPMGTFPLAKQLKDKNHLDFIQAKLADFQLIAGGFELCSAFSELNDPIEQRKRFEEQEKLYKKGFKEAQRTDKDFLEALEHGMPPAAGFGMGIDRLVALLTNSHSIKEVILFPTMRPKK